MVPEELVYHLLFAGPAALLAVSSFIVPIIFNPYAMGFPFHPPLCNMCKSKPKEPKKNFLKTASSRIVDLKTFMKSSTADEHLDRAIGRVNGRPDVELGSLATKEFGNGAISVADPIQLILDGKQVSHARLAGLPKNSNKGDSRGSKHHSRITGSIPERAPAHSNQGYNQPSSHGRGDKKPSNSRKSSPVNNSTARSEI